MIFVQLSSHCRGIDLNGTLFEHFAQDLVPEQQDCSEFRPEIENSLFTC